MATSSGTTDECVAPASTDAMAGSRILCVDLDGTLIRSDLLWECMISVLKRQPQSLFLAPVWLLSGRANLKTQLAQRAQIDVKALPYNQEVVEFLNEQHTAGKHLVLVTACAPDLAHRVSDWLGIFKACFASSNHQNLRGRAKAELLRQQYGERGFEYLGNSTSDLPVWQVASTAHVVGKPALASKARRIAPLGRVFPVEQATFRTWIAAVRGHHWLKNILLFLPLALAHRFDRHSWMMTGLAFVLFGLCASGIYVLNDLLDLHSDRVHPWKSKRPFAAGDVSIPAGLLIACVLLLFALPASFLVGTNFGLVLTGYCLLTMWYSVYLKRVVILDVFVLSAFYSVRILGGALVSAVPLSHWFVSFSLFFFLSLSMSKRYSELVHAGELVEQGRSGRAYLVEDSALLLNLGIASGFSAVVIFSLYVHSPEVLVLYPHPAALMLLAPTVAYWLSRLWLKATRGELHEDPVVVAMKDPVSYFAAIIGLVVLIASTTRLH